MNEFVRREEFSKDEYAVIGQFLVAVTNLDDVIGRSSVRLLGMADKDKGATNIVASSSLSRFEKFLKLLEKSCSEMTWIDDLKSEIENLMQWRNAMCHGRYSRGSCGAIRIEFFDKSSAKNSTMPPERCLSVAEAAALSNEANQISFEIHNRLLNP